MNSTFLQRFSSVVAFAIAVTMAAPGAQAQALHPLPNNLLTSLTDVDQSADEMAAAVLAIKNADLTYSMFSRQRVEQAIARMEQQLPVLKNQTADLRRTESLGVLLSVRTAFSDVQRNIGSVSDILHGVTVRTPMQANELDKLLVRLDGAGAKLDSAIKRFDTGTLALTAPGSRASATGSTPLTTSDRNISAAQAPAQGEAGVSTTMARPSAPTASTQVPTLHPLPANLLATLMEIDTSSDEMAASVLAIKNADLTYSMFSRNRVERSIAKMEQQLPTLKKQTTDLRREESLGVLLSMRTAFSAVQREVGSVSDILHGVTVRTPVQANELDKLLARLDGAAARLDTALKQFDTRALATIEVLDKPVTNKP